MKAPPKDWPRLSSALFYEDGLAAIDWLCAAFGFEVRIKVLEQKKLVHSELTFEGAVVMVGQLSGRPERAFCRSPRGVGGGNTQSLMLYIEDVAAHCQRARAAGAVIATEPRVSDYGPDYWSDKSYEAVDLEGHHWWFCERIRG
jgi:uncharacterized glyoxalase superfamily protein PhnB